MARGSQEVLEGDVLCLLQGVEGAVCGDTLHLGGVGAIRGDTSHLSLSDTSGWSQREPTPTPMPTIVP